MLTVSIADSLQGPSALSEWGDHKADAGYEAEAWQQQMLASHWGLESTPADSELSATNLQDAWSMTSNDPSAWGSWPTDAVWNEAEIAQMAAVEASLAASLALAAKWHPASAKHAPNKPSSKSKAAPAPANPSAWASPLRVPVPENLDVGSELEVLELPEAEDMLEEPQRISPTLSPSTLTRTVAAAPKPLALAEATDHAPPGIAIHPGVVAGLACRTVDWKIEDFRGKLQASMGRPVVSPAFAVCGLANLRLMVFPDARNAVKNARSHERKGLYSNMVKKGPLYCSLKLKTDGLEKATVMTFSLVVGGVHSGPIKYDFSEQAVQGLEDIGVDWLQQIEAASGALTVGIEIVEVRQK